MRRRLAGALGVEPDARERRATTTDGSASRAAARASRPRRSRCCVAPRRAGPPVRPDAYEAVPRASAATASRVERRRAGAARRRRAGASRARRWRNEPSNGPCLRAGSKRRPRDGHARRAGRRRSAGRGPGRRSRRGPSAPARASGPNADPSARARARRSRPRAAPARRRRSCDRGGGVRADAGQLGQVGRPAASATTRRGPVEVDRAAVVAEPLPGADHVGRRRGGERPAVGQRSSQAR